MKQFLEEPSISRYDINRGSDLKISQFNILQNLPRSIELAKSIYELDSQILNVSISVINEINNIILTSEAVSFLTDAKETLPRAFPLIDMINDKVYVTEYGCRYIDYFLDKIINLDK